MPAKVIATCKLCRSPSVPIRDSHIVPRWAHLLARPAEGGDPVVISDRRAVQKSEHVREYLLCSDCEQMFGDVENRIAAIACQADGSNPVLDLLGNAVEAIDDGVRVVLPGKVNTAELVYFGASILWRASISTRVSNCALGSEYEERFRLYLLGQRAFPEDATCVVAVHDQPLTPGPNLGSVLTTPATEHFFGHDGHRFLVGGFLFCIYTGRLLPEFATCFATSALEQPLMLLAPEWTLLQWLGPFLRAPAFGKLVRRYPNARQGV